MIPATTDVGLGMVRQLEADILEQEQISLDTTHTLHAGVYTRTIMIPAGCVVTGVVIKIDTVLILAGDASVFVGDSVVRFTGYNVLPASAGRKTAVLAHADTYATMVFKSEAEAVEDAEAEFTDEASTLSSRKEGYVNNVISEAQT